MENNIYKKKQIVNKYDLSRVIPDEILQDYCKQIIHHTNPKNICDVGFGKGSVLLPFASYKEIQVTGIDCSKSMCNFVNSELKKKDLSAKIISEDVCNISSLLGEYDLVHLKAVTHIPKYPEYFLRKISHLVRDNRYLVIGKEYSQPEDNLENINKYGEDNQEDKELKDFYDFYFKIRTEDNKPFVPPLMPAGDYDKAQEYLTANWGKRLGFLFDTEISTKRWDKKLSFSDLIESIRFGTFTVFSKKCTSSDREKYAKIMENYCLNKGFDLDESRSYPAQLKAVILKKDILRMFVGFCR